MKSIVANLSAVLFAVMPLLPSAKADPWPQFRGPFGSGVSAEKLKLPEAIAPDKNVVWQVDVPAGVSSPVIHSGRLYLTGVEGGNKLVTFAVSVEDGSMLWSAEGPIRKLETTDKKPAGRLATPTVAIDGKHVVSFFGSSGLLCYSTEGNRLWYRPMGPFDNRRGAASSPVIHNGWVILAQDHEVGSFVEAIDITNGKTVWRTERSLFNRSYVTPALITDAKNQTQIILTGSGLVTSYDFKTGKPLWFVKGTSAVANPTAVFGGGRIYVASANPGPKREFQPDFATLVKQRDKDNDGQLTASELPDGFFPAMFSTYDTNKNSQLDESEYVAIQQFMKSSSNGLIAINPVGNPNAKTLDRTETNKLWRVTRSTPRNGTPIYFEGHLYMMKDGGVFTSLNAKTGEVVKSERIPANGKYFSSPVIGDGKIYVTDDRGQVAVLSAKPQWEVLSHAKFGEPIYPTPAIVGGRIYVRTESKLFSFGHRAN